MAAAEIVASSSDLRVLKKEESCGRNSPVILHVEHVLHGNNNDITSTATAVMAIRSHNDESKSRGEEIEYGYPITCGDSSGVLLFKKFICPGINVKCVKFNGQLISPKQFVHLSGKATLKDWKRAIRLGGVMLRKMMDSGQIDFYQHNTVCSNTCRSTKCDVLISSSRVPPGTVVNPSPSCLDPDPLRAQLPPLTVPFLSGEDFNDATEAEEILDFQSSQPTITNGHPAKKKKNDPPDNVLGLWRKVAESGLLGNVLSSLQAELLRAFKGMEARSEKTKLQIKDAMILNSLCEMFGLLESVNQAVELKRNLNEENHNQFYGLEKTLRKRKKVEKTLKAASSKQLRLEHHGSLSRCLNILSPVTTAPVIVPLSAIGLSEHTLSPLHFSHLSASVSTDTGPPLQLSDKLIGDGRKVPKRLREKSNTRRQGENKEDREARQRTATSEKEPHHREEGDETNS